MGNLTAFLDIPRRTAAKEPVPTRVRHWREFILERSPQEIQEQASRCMHCGVPFCHGAGCPLGNLIPDMNELVEKGRWREASEILHQTNNFPEITGRICPALCEASCVNAIHGEAVTIREIEWAVAERAWSEGWICPQPPHHETSRSVAVIGAGPAGLACAQQLRRAGHAVTVFEKSDRPGGLLRYGIPDFKLEKRILDRRLAQMEAEGVRFRCGIEAGVDIGVEELRKNVDVIVLTGGAGIPRDLKVPGRELKGVHFAMEYLSQSNRRQAGIAIPEEEAILATHKRVIVIGGGDTGSDCVGTAHRQGATEVIQLELLPQPPELRGPDNPWPQWPLILRTSTSHEEGGERAWCIHTLEILGEGGRVTGLRCVRVTWTKDSAGGWKMEPIPGSEFTLQADLILLAMGFVHPKHEGLLDALGVAYDKRGNVQVDGMMMTSVPGVFAAGDMNTGAWLVVGAIAAGRRVARRIDLFLMGESDLPDCELPPKFEI